MTTGAWAQRILAAQDGAMLMPRPTVQAPSFGLATAYGVADAVRQLRMNRGERPVGYKIGFTNRTIWPKYGVHAPIWGPVWAGTLHEAADAQAHTSLAGWVQPRLEPEIVFGWREPPRPGMSERELVDCLGWVAHGFEIVHTHYDQWRFEAADAVADGALHAGLWVGPRLPLDAFGSPAKELAQLTLELCCDGVCVDRGQGSVVLDGPIAALQVWLAAMYDQPHGWQVRAGDVVTTGTLTDAWPLKAGQVWTTRLNPPQLAGMTLRVLD